ncbi:asparaginyl-tRNA synthetase [Zychaea mexicana]|uniref:asparaginyl-tRNA synthetase n=1 Tax=Zychaea mexicana TaxID=64656 RepID=UPI0022FE1EDB|nr:asparaginyl-tRNA synthetase [Zychaea mexicana]KAI9485021.1 asparaginyl-tRNA synthetase [Zychaea mexicana]
MTFSALRSLQLSRRSLFLNCSRSHSTNTFPLTVRSLLDNNVEAGSDVTVKGWVRSVRKQKQISFANINDGTSVRGLQAILSSEQAERLSTGSCVELQGTLVKSPGKEQGKELQVSSMDILGECDSTFPMQKKRHTFEYLRTINHLRARGNAGSASLRVRHAARQGLQDYFAKHEFTQVDTPILTSHDCEGGGEVFKVTPGSAASGNAEFFNKPAFLTVSGQLHAEMFASALSRVYTFGPVFRAEESLTSRHLAEFWMLEAEVAFIDLEQLLDITEGSIKHATRHVLDTCPEEMEFFDKWVAKKDVKGKPALLKRLRNSLDKPFARIDYKEAVQLLQGANKKFEFPTTWGSSLQSEHERYLASEECKDRPVFVKNYPSDQKPFYMLENDGKQKNNTYVDEHGSTVACFDLLLPGIGELVGGSMREDREDVLESKMKAAGMDTEEYGWYLELRKYGSAPHGGYGIGFERFMLWLTGFENVREVVPVPRWVGHCKY